MKGGTNEVFHGHVRADLDTDPGMAKAKSALRRRTGKSKVASDHDTLPGGPAEPPGSPMWRDALLADVRGADVGRATSAVLAFTSDEPERAVTEALLSECLDPTGPAVDPQVRALAVTCVGHVVRIHGEVGPDLVARVRGLLQDSALGGRAEDALDDIASFVPHAPAPRRGVG